MKLISYRGVLVTQDTAAALKKLEEKASEGGWRFHLVGPAPDSIEDSHKDRSLAWAGREVHITLDRSDKVYEPQTAVNALWAYAVPLGFTPYRRYPDFRGSNADKVFHYLGHWQHLHDRMLAEGRGHLAMPSVCAAAQAAVDRWEGEHPTAVFLQGQLHRLGRNCGPVDGVIGPRTLAAIESLGIDTKEKGLSIPEIGEWLRIQENPKVDQGVVEKGHILIHGRRVVAQGTGGVQVQQTPQGPALYIRGPGRVVIDVGEKV